MIDNNKNGLYKLGYVASENWIEFLSRIVPENVKVSAQAVNDFIESTDFRIEYFDIHSNPCEEAQSIGFYFKTPYLNKHGETIYGIFNKNNQGGFVGVRWSSLEHERREKLQNIGYISDKSWEDLRLICKNDNINDYGDFILLPEIYWNGAGYMKFSDGTPVTRKSGKFAVIYTNLQNEQGEQMIGWFTKDNRNSWKGIEWGTKEDFESAQDRREAIKLGRFLFEDMNALNKFVDDVQKLLIPEPWDYPNNESGRHHPILCSYLECELDRLFLEYDDGKENAIIFNDKRTEIYYSTNLLNKYGKDFCILGILDESKKFIKSCILAPSMSELVTRGFPRNCEPAAPHFFDAIDQIIYHSEWIIDFDLQKDKHIFEDREFRFPERYQDLEAHEKGQKLQNAIAFAESIARRNYKVIIPKYDPRKQKIQLLMPIYLESMYCDEPDFALVLTPEIVHRDGEADFHYYHPETILEMKQAYNDARLIAEPSEPWLAKTVIQED